jgi:hypothetical protein
MQPALYPHLQCLAMKNVNQMNTLGYSQQILLTNQFPESYTNCVHIIVEVS